MTNFWRGSGRSCTRASRCPGVWTTAEVRSSVSSSSEVRVFAGWANWGAAGAGLFGRVPDEVLGGLGEAVAAAGVWHEGQARPGGEPYLQHLLQVVEVLAVGLGVTDGDLLRAGVLHDVVEDTDGTAAEVEERFGRRTAELVAAVTIPEVGESKGSVRSAYLAKLVHAPRDVLVLKLSDRYSNVQRLHTHPRVAKQRSYYAETVEHFVPLAGVDERLQAWFQVWADAYSYLTGPVDSVESVGKLAAAVHREQTDKGGAPYVLHVRAVAEIARRNGADEYQQMAGLLHDSVEDERCTVEQLQELGVPGRVLELVDALTHRADEDDDGYLTRLARTPGAVLIKRADIENNTDPARRAHLDVETRERLDAKYAHYLEVLEQVGDDQ
ncbi:HD domain-containing protein [Kribbella sp. NPDC048928]|uniref:HD domain-containing protein n=1 Tax=Kribbella sp. NPDC048928 TaxID=3364111 RepID=UPI0037245683